MNNLSYYQNSKCFLMETWYIENRSSTFWTKIKCEADMFETISSTEDTKIFFKKKVERLVILGVLEISKESEWGDLYFAQPRPKQIDYVFLVTL